MVDTKLFQRAVYAEDIDLAKLGWTECRDDKLIMSYIRGYIWRNYKVRIKPPLDWIIFCMLDGCLSQEQRMCKKEFPKTLQPLGTKKETRIPKWKAIMGVRLLIDELERRYLAKSQNKQ